MKRHPSLVPLSWDHQRILVLAQLLKKDAPKYKGLPDDLQGKRTYGIKQYEQLLKPHEAREEQQLFPKIQNKNGRIDDLIADLKTEHKIIEAGFAEMRNPRYTTAAMDQLGRLMEKHVRTEERILFDLIQKHLSSRELEEIKIDS